VVQVLALAVWFSASAVVPTLQREWGITATGAVWLTSSVQIGFVIGAVMSATTSLADRIRPHVLLAASATGAAACTALFALFADDLLVGLPFRVLTGVFLAGVYPVGMKLMASWTTANNRGRSFGVLLGALTLGSALPHLIGVLDVSWHGLMVCAAGVTFSGALVGLLVVRPGPEISERGGRMDPRHLVRMFRDAGPRLINLGYFGHMWELYAMWTWLPSFVLASRGHQSVTTVWVAVGLFISIGVAGVIGCLIGGWAADRFGRSRTAMIALAVSGSCCLLTPVVFFSPWLVLVLFAAVWGASVIADSGIFSSLLTENTDRRYVGTALTAQTAIGFLLTVVTIQVVPLVAEVTGWQFAFLVLLPGPVIGISAMGVFAVKQTKKIGKE
jgi:Sugar phosphate permease